MPNFDGSQAPADAERRFDGWPGDPEWKDLTQALVQRAPGAWPGALDDFLRTTRARKRSMGPRTCRVFVSHQHLDAQRALRIAWLADQNGFEYWLDVHDPVLRLANSSVLPPPVHSILVAGIIARYPFGGVTWCSLMYLLGLRALGHEVFYVEDTGECIYDPVENTISKDPGYGTRYIHAALEPFGLGDRWTFVNWDGTYHGASHERLRAFCADADLYINLSGGSWFWRDEYARIPRSIFIDSDPVFTQLALAKGEGWYVDFFTRFDHLFTFGANIGTPACDVPTSGFTWHKTWQPIVLDQWQTPPGSAGDRFTTVMTWKIESFADVDGNKDIEFVKFMDVASRSRQPIELAVNGPQGLLRSRGWQTVDAMGVSRSLWDYRAFLQGSKGEFGVAKHAYVSRRSGWFSDRTECYLAAGRPAIVQDTGWSAHLPSGEGLVGFSTLEEALEGLDRVGTDHARHSRMAEAIAREHFDAGRVLPPLLEIAGR